MPFGVSDRNIEQAFGPQDFSYIYKKLEATQQRLRAEDALYRKEAQKEYAAKTLGLDKDIAGVRSIDVPVITEKFDRWKTIGTELVNNKSLARTNPTQYTALKKEYGVLGTNIRQNIAGSKEWKKRELDTYDMMNNPRTREDFYDGADKDWKVNVMDKPWEEIVKNGKDDLSVYFSGSIPTEKFYTTMASGVNTSLRDYTMEDKEKTKKLPAGEVFRTEYKKMPSLGGIHDAVENSFRALPDQRQIKFVEQELGKVIGDKEKKIVGDVEKTQIAWDNFYDPLNPNGYKKYGLPDKKPDLFAEGQVPKELFINYLAAKEFLSKLPISASKSGAEFVSQSGKMRFGANLSFSNQKEMAKYKKALKDDGTEVVIADFTPTFDAISKGGEEGIQATKEFTDKFNQLVGSAAYVLPITAAKKYAGNTMFTDGNRWMVDKISPDFVMDDPHGPPLKAMADAVNKNNRTNGFINSDITPGSLRSGKAFLYYIDKDNYVVVDPSQKNSRTYVNKRIRTAQLSTKDTRSTISADVAGGYDPTDPLGKFRQQ